MVKAKSGIVLIFAITLAFCGGDAMFGLTWGMSPSKIKESGITLVKKEATNNLYHYKADSLPKNISISEGYTLIFDEDSSLVKIIMNSFTFDNDPYGTTGKEKFDNIVNLLKQKYKIKNTYCYSGRKLYEEADEFYQCLEYSGCGTWAVFLTSENKDIIVELKGLDRASGYIKITVEANPGFSNALEKFKAKKNSKDSDAF